MSTEGESRATAPTRGLRRSGLRRGMAAGLRRGLVLGTGAALVAGLLGGAPSTGSGRSPEVASLAPVAAVSSPELRTFSLNVAFSLGKLRAGADMRRALTGLDASVGGFQEISQREDRDQLHAMLRELDWGWYQPRGIAIPVVFDRDRFRLVEGRTVKVHGAQAGVTPSRYLNIVTLRELDTDRIFGVINTHTICCASRDAQLSNMHRIPRLRKHFSMLRDELVALRRETEQVVAMGDLNVNYLADRRRQLPGLPTDRLGDIVSFDMPLEGSRGRTSLLDYTMSTKTGSLDRTDGRIVRGFNSDHQAVVITYDVADAEVPDEPEAPEDPKDPKDPKDPEMPAGPDDAEAPPAFDAGPLTTTLAARGASDRAVLDRVVEVVRAAHPGSVLRVATRRIRDAAVLRALRDAAGRGVLVRVLLHRGARYARERQLARLLRDGSTSTWVRRARTNSHASFLLARSTGTSRNVTISLSSPLTWRAHRTLTDAYLATDGRTYTAFRNAFTGLVSGRTARVRRSAARATGDNLGVRFGPSPRRSADPVALALRPLACAGSTSPRTWGGRSQVRVAMRAWSGRRGRALAHRVGRESRRGCHVQVLAGPGVGRGVVRILRRARVQVRRGAVGEALVLVDGRYGGRSDQQRTWTGTDVFSDAGSRQVSQTLELRSEATLVAYRQQFHALWRRVG